MALFLALAWLPVTSHCQMEVIPGFEFLQCGSSATPDDHCEEDGCCAVESSDYHVTRHEDLAFAGMVLIASAADPSPTIQNFLPKEVSLGVLTAAPPEFARTWQFLSRTALPVRAPSFVS